MDWFHGSGVRTNCIIRSNSNILCALLLVKSKILFDISLESDQKCHCFLDRNRERNYEYFRKFTGICRLSF